MQLEIGQSASISRTVSQSDVVAFAAATGDDNPLHLDMAFAKQSRFGVCVAHGMWSASLISAVIGTRLPGQGSIYLSQPLKFEAPVYIGNTVTATVTVVRIRVDKPIVTLEAVCRDQDGRTVVQGEAVVWLEEMPKT